MRPLLFCLLLILTGCSIENEMDKKNEEISVSYPVVLFNVDSIDINSDNIIDFYFHTSTYATDDLSNSNTTYFLQLEPNSNFLLYRDNEEYQPFSYGDTIQENMDSLFSWASYNADIIHINMNNDDGWDEEWSGLWVNEIEKYLPIGLSLNDSMYFGWLWLSVETEEDTAKVTVHGYNYNQVAGQLITAGE